MWSVDGGKSYMIMELIINWFSVVDDLDIKGNLK